MDRSWRGMLTKAIDIDDIRRKALVLKSRSDPERAREIVTLRRQLSSYLIALSEEAKVVFADEAGGAEAKAFQSLYSNVLSKVALHQADWPAITINDNSTAYIQSTRNVDAAIEALCRWIQEQAAEGWPPAHGDDVHVGGPTIVKTATPPSG